jgi:hypothetical protein
MNDTNDELEAQIRAALARKRQQQQQQQPAKPAAPPPQPVIVSAGMVRNPAGQPAAAPRPAAPPQPSQAGAQPTPRPAPQPAAPQATVPPPVQPAPSLSAHSAAGGMVLDPSERLGGPTAASTPQGQSPLQQLGPRFATPEAALANAAAAAAARQQPTVAPPSQAAPAAGSTAEDGRRALGALLARSAQQTNTGDTQIPPPPGQVLGRIGVEQQPAPAGAPAPKEKPYRHPFFTGKRHLWPMLIIPAVSIGIVLILFYFLIWELGGEGVVDIAPLIEAEQTPLKVRPDEEGGMEIPNQDMEIYSEIDGATVPDPAAEQLVPAPEQPVIPEVPEAAEAAEPAAEPTTPVVEAPSLEPGTDTATEPATTEGATATETTATEPAAEPAAVETNDAVPTAESTEVPETAQPEPVTQEAALPPGAYRIQLAAVRSEEGARAAWQELQAKLPELASLQLHIERIDLGGNGIYYRVQGGPLPNKDAASTLCSRLGSRGQDCLVVNP